MTWGAVVLKLRVSFDVLVSRKKFLSESSQHTQTHIYVFLEVDDVYISVVFELCIDEDFIEIW